MNSRYLILKIQFSSIYSNSSSPPINTRPLRRKGWFEQFVRKMRSSKASWKNGKRVSPMRIKPRNKYWTYLLTLNGNGARYPCINRSRHAHAEIHIHRWKGEVEEGEQYLESTRIERSRRVLCHQYT